MRRELIWVASLKSTSSCWSRNCLTLTWACSSTIQTIGSIGSMERLTRRICHLNVLVLSLVLHSIMGSSSICQSYQQLVSKFYWVKNWIWMITLNGIKRQRSPCAKCLHMIRRCLTLYAILLLWMKIISAKWLKLSCAQMAEILNWLPTIEKSTSSSL